MIRIPIVAAVLALNALNVAVLVAQVPTKPAPTAAPPLAITLHSVKLNDASRATYVRAGTLPNQYRASTTSNFSGAAWVSFTESNTTTSTKGSVTLISAALPHTTGFVNTSGRCAALAIPHRIFLQMRRQSVSGLAMVSNVVADSICVPQG